jgi:hypothetical protein
LIRAKNYVYTGTTYPYSGIKITNNYKLLVRSYKIDRAKSSLEAYATKFYKKVKPPMGEQFGHI